MGALSFLDAFPAIGVGHGGGFRGYFPDELSSGKPKNSEPARSVSRGITPMSAIPKGETWQTRHWKRW